MKGRKYFGWVVGGYFVVEVEFRPELAGLALVNL